MKIKLTLSLLTIFLLLSTPLWSVTVKIISGKEKTAVLENKYIRAVFSEKGGKLISFVNKTKNIDTTWNDGTPQSGALKDFISIDYPRRTMFSKTTYKMTIGKNSSAKASLILSTSGFSDMWKFIKITKTIVLKKNESVLVCSIDIFNMESSQSTTYFPYWSHNFFGLPNEKNINFLPDSQGMIAYEPDKKSNKDKLASDLVRGWSAVIGDSSKVGVTCNFDYKYFSQAYNWWCKGGKPMNTMEWKLMAVPIKEGTHFKTEISIGLFNGLNAVHGSGEAGVGSITTPSQWKANSKNKVTIKLAAFKNTAAKAIIYLRSDKIKKIGQLPVNLKTGQINTLNFQIPASNEGSKVIICEIVSQGKLLFDLQKLVQVGKQKTAIQLTPRESILSFKSGDRNWNLDLSYNYITPHYDWQKPFKRGKIKALFLLPTSSCRDIVELHQRMDIEPRFPTIFPKNDGMGSWRTENKSRGKNGLDTVGKYLAMDNEVIIIGKQNRRHNQQPKFTWNKIPSSLRGDILKKVKNGAGLIIVNPREIDDLLRAAIKNTKVLDGKHFITRNVSFDLIDKITPSSIKVGKYGKGRIVILDYGKYSASLLPQTRIRSSTIHPRRKYTYRYHEYQFALLIKAITWASKKESALEIESIVLKNVQLRQDTTKKSTFGLKLKSTGAGKNIQIVSEIFDCYTKLVHKQRAVHKINKTLSLNISYPLSLPGGINVIHLKVLDMKGNVLDFGFKKLIIIPKCKIKKIVLNKKYYNPGETVKGKINISGTLKTGMKIKVDIYDGVGRQVYSSTGKNSFAWPIKNAVVKNHYVHAQILQGQKILSEKKEHFTIPGIHNVLTNYPSLIWAGGRTLPEYAIIGYMDQLINFGFNFVYASSTADTQFMYDLSLVNTEMSVNWHAYYKLYGANADNKKGFQLWNKTQDKQYLVKPYCLSDPEIISEAMARVDRLLDNLAPIEGRHLFLLGDEMSICFYQSPWDICFGKHTLTAFRKWLKTEYKSLGSLNKQWETNFKTWEKVIPKTTMELVGNYNLSSWSDHRTFMDLVFKDHLELYRKKIQTRYPGASVGPTGVSGKPAPYGGNWDFWNMRIFGSASMYGNDEARITCSFNRNSRNIFKYRGYDFTPSDTVHSIWEGLFIGQRGLQQWHGPIFIRPDLGLSINRKYFSDLMWELRNGTGDLFYNSEKIIDKIAIHHSMNSVRANFMKEEKGTWIENLWTWCHVLEDLALGYRYLDTEEIEKGSLKNFKVLILPESSALSQKEAKEIKLFVKKGGLLIGDYEIAIMDKRCRALEAGLLDDVFGIKQKGWCGFTKIKKVVVNPDPAILQIKEKTISAKFAGKFIKLAGGKAFGAMKVSKKSRVPILIYNSYGKGNAFYLNFRPDYYSDRTIDKGQEFKSLFLEMMKYSGITRAAIVRNPITKKEIDRVEIFRYRNGQNLYYGIIPEPPFGNWNDMSLIDIAKKRFNAEIKFKDKGHLYDTRAKKYLGYGNQFTIKIIPGDGLVLSMLPYKVITINESMQKKIKQGNTLHIKLKVIVKGGSPSHHIIVANIKDPTGKSQLHYRKIIETQNGEGGFSIPIGLNEKKGTWTIELKDGASGVAKIISFKVI